MEHLPSSPNTVSAFLPAHPTSYDCIGHSLTAVSTIHLLPNTGRSTSIKYNKVNYFIILQVIDKPEREWGGRERDGEREREIGREGGRNRESGR